MNFYNHHNGSIFKSHSISVSFKFCAVLGAQGIHATGFKRAQGNAHCAKFESNTNRMTFEYAPNMMIVKVHPQYLPLLSSGLIKLHFCHMTQLAQLQLSYPHKIFSALGVRDLVSCS